MTDETERAGQAAKVFFEMALELIKSGALPPARVAGALAGSAAKIMAIHLGPERASEQLRLLADILQEQVKTEAARK